MSPSHCSTAFLLALVAGTALGQDEERPLYRTPYPAINVHRHCKVVSEPALRAELAAMDRTGIRAVVILDGGTTDGNLPGWVELRKKYPGRLIILANIDFSRIKKPGFFEWIVEELERQAKMGAQGIKISKSLGMSHRDADGKLLKGDDPRLDPFWAKCGELGLPVLIHMSDPREYWYPLTYNTYHYGLRAEKDQHTHNKEMPPWEELIRQRDHILEKHPRTNFIGAHMGSLTFNLQQLAETLDKYPNFFVDCSARTRILGRLNRPAVHDFFVKYQDRILFGTDSGLSEKIEADDAKGMEDSTVKTARFFSRHLEYFDTDHVGLVEAYGTGKEWLRVSGVKLPPEALRKFYYLNAEKLLVGVEPAGPQTKEDDEKGFVPLFNGRDLEGLSFFFSDKDHDPARTFSVVDGVLTCTGKPEGYWHTGKDYRNFTLRFDVRYKKSEGDVDEMTWHGNSGCLLFLQEHKIWPRSLEIQGRNRDLLTIVPIRTWAKFETDGEASKKARKPLGEWNSIEIASRNGVIACSLNGVLVSTVRKCEFKEGPIAFQSEGVEIHWRNVLIREE